MIARVLSCPGLITDILGMFVAFVKKSRVKTQDQIHFSLPEENPKYTSGRAGESSAYSEVNVTHLIQLGQSSGNVPRPHRIPPTFALVYFARTCKQTN